MSEISTKLNETEQQIFEAIDDSDTVLLRTALSSSPNVNIVDENFMTPLQHAAYKGNRDLVQMLLDHGADPNLCKHQHNYTALHFGGLSGNVDVCLALLVAGAKSGATNAVNRTASQMAAFVGNHPCVSVINNFVPKADVEYYTVLQGVQTTPYLPPFLSESFHKFVMQINIHPVKVVLNLGNFVGLSDHLPEVKKVLEMMRDKEMRKGPENNEVMAFKFHYLSYIVGEVIQICKLKKAASEDKDKKGPIEFADILAKKILKPNKDGSLELLNNLLREAVKEFPFMESTLFKQMVSTLASQEAPPALSVVNSAINGQRGFIDNVSTCHTCGEEKPSKKCSKCKSVQYCDRNCQRLHWHFHKKVCRMADGEAPQAIQEKVSPDAAELSSEISKLLVQE